MTEESKKTLAKDVAVEVVPLMKDMFKVWMKNLPKKRQDEINAWLQQGTWLIVIMLNVIAIIAFPAMDQTLDVTIWRLLFAFSDLTIIAQATSSWQKREKSANEEIKIMKEALDKAALLNAKQGFEIEALKLKNKELQKIN